MNMPLTYTLKDRRYCWDAGDKKLKMNFPSGKNPPGTLFKYYALTQNSVSALTNLYLYATHPAQFNDLFDCCDNLIIIDNENDAKGIWEDLYDKAKSMFSTKNKFLINSTKAFTTLMYKKYGVLSLTSLGADDIMWSRYANNEGFCVEFDYTKFPFEYHGPFYINYQKELQTLNSSLVGLQISALYQTTLKKDCWEYESEYRLLIDAPKGLAMKTFGLHSEQYNFIGDHDRKFRYPLYAIKSITLGAHFVSETDLFITNPFQELEIIADGLKKEILDFLTNIDIFRNNIKLYLCYKNGTQIGRFPIQVIKLKENKFRIVELEND